MAFPLKEHKMDKTFFFQNAAKERQAEISKELANHQLLRGDSQSHPAAIRVKRLAVLGARVMVAFTILLLFYFFG